MFSGFRSRCTTPCASEREGRSAEDLVLRARAGAQSCEASALSHPLVSEVQELQQLRHDARRLLLREVVLLEDFLEQLAAGAQLHNDRVVVIVLEDLVNLQQSRKRVAQY